ncbi:hypothetical protein TSAR_000527 [Trichomalopsis sarcophagae]|uniref:Uncharacterized protein n=1 Tax=Trichomalopsis sarcophagae TaxID=543379 RepID=A0A232FJZ9_9HYME|nr:hypothetical protein TSAR_000527 [Trichomalopsis sarcophagae]
MVQGGTKDAEEDRKRREPSGRKRRYRSMTDIEDADTDPKGWACWKNRGGKGNRRDARRKFCNSKILSFVKTSRKYFLVGYKFKSPVFRKYPYGCVILEG